MEHILPLAFGGTITAAGVIRSSFCTFAFGAAFLAVFIYDARRRFPDRHAAKSTTPSRLARSSTPNKKLVHYAKRSNDSITIHHEDV